MGIKKNQRQIERHHQIAIKDELRPKNHTYSLPVIQFALSLVISVGISFRAVSKLFVEMNLYLSINLGTPTHTTILNWTKKQGVGNFREKDFFDKGEWVLIVDESIQFGNRKLLFVAVVPSNFSFAKGYISYNDLVPLVIKASTSWKSEAIADEISKRISLDRIAYAVCDNGNNLVKTFHHLNIAHVQDINHKFSWIMQQMLESDPKFTFYTKTLAGMRKRLTLSKSARIVPPNQRVVSRYMNLKPLFEWGVKMLALLQTDSLTEEEIQELNFLHGCKDFVMEIYELIIVLNQIQQQMKNSGFTSENVLAATGRLNSLQSDYALKAGQMIKEYFQNTQSKAQEYKSVLCSSDIMESCFSKYKDITKANKTVGISDLSLCLSAMLGKSSKEMKHNFERIKTKQVKEWKIENIGRTLFADKKDLMKKAG